MVLTQRGRGVAVLVDAHEYERMQERLEVLEEIYKAEEQIAAGDGVRVFRHPSDDCLHLAGILAAEIVEGGGCDR